MRSDFMLHYHTAFDLVNGYNQHQQTVMKRQSDHQQRQGREVYNELR